MFEAAVKAVPLKGGFLTLHYSLKNETRRNFTSCGFAYQVLTKKLNLAAVFGNYIFNSVGRYTSVNFFTDHYNRGKAAGANTAETAQ